MRRENADRKPANRLSEKLRNVPEPGTGKICGSFQLIITSREPLVPDHAPSHAWVPSEAQELLLVQDTRDLGIQAGAKELVARMTKVVEYGGSHRIASHTHASRRKV